jgi:hypothetical protein
VDAHLLNLQRLQNRVVRATGKLDRCASVRELRMAFKLPYVYGYITNLCRTQAEVKVKLSLYQAMEAHRVVRRRGSHMF